MNLNKLDHYQKLCLWILYRMVAKQWASRCLYWHTTEWEIAMKVGAWHSPEYYNEQYQKHDIHILTAHWADRADYIMGVWDSAVVSELMQKGYIRIEHPNDPLKQTIVLTRRGFQRGYFLNKCL